MKKIGITFALVLLLCGAAFGQSDCDVWLGTWDVTYNDESTYVWVIDEIVTGVSANIRCQALGTSTPTEGGESFPFQIISLPLNSCIQGSQLECLLSWTFC